MKQSLRKWLSRLAMTLIALAIGVPLSRATVTVNIKATNAPYVYAWYSHNNETVEPLGAWPGSQAVAAQNLQGEAVWHVDVNNETADQYTPSVSIIIHNNGGGDANKTGDITNMGSGLYEYSYDGFTKLTPIEICKLNNGFWYGHQVMSSPYESYVLDYQDGVSFGYLSKENTTYNKVYAWNATTGKKYTANFPGDDLSTTVTAPEVRLNTYQTGGYTFSAKDYYAFDFNLENGNDPGPDHVIFVDSNSAYEDNGSTQYSTRTGDLLFINGAVYTGDQISWTVRPSRDIDASLIPSDFVRNVITGDIVDMENGYYSPIDINHDGKLSNYELLSAWSFDYRTELPEKWGEYEHEVDPTNLPAITSLAGLEIFPYLIDINIEYPLGDNVDDDEDGYSEFSLRDFGFSEGHLGNVVIPALPHLGYLKLNNCGVTSIDLSNVPLIYRVELTGNRLTSIDVSGCEGLESLRLSDNLIPANGVTGLDKVQKLNLSRNPITSFAPVSNSITDLAVDVCQMTSLDVSGLPNLQELSASANQLTSINLTHNPSLYRIQLARNKLSGIDLSGQVTPPNSEGYYINLSCNDLGTLDVSGLANLKELNVKYCNLTSITLPTTLQQYNEIHLNGNNLSNLDLSYVTNLRDLYASHNPLGTLTLGSQPELRTLWAPTAQLTALDLSECTKLRDIYLSHNQLNETNTQWPPKFTGNNGSPAPRRSVFQDLSQRLQERATAKRQHEQLSGKANVSGPRREEEVYRGVDALYVNNNEFRTLSVSGMPYLEYMFSANNQLSALDFSNQDHFQEGFAEMISMWYGYHEDYDDYVSPMFMIRYNLSKELCNQIASHGYTAEQIATMKNSGWMDGQEDIIREVVTDPSVYNDLGAGNRREVTPEWATRNGNDVYFIRLDNEAAGTKGLLTENTFLGPDFVMADASDWTNAQVVEDPDYGNILLLTATGESDGNATGAVTYSYDTHVAQESADDMMKSVTFGFTWTAPAAPTIEEEGVVLTPGDGTVYGGYTQVVITIPDGTTVTATIDGETVDIETDGTNTYIKLPSDRDSGIEGHTVVITPSEGDPVTATYTHMPTPGDETHWTSVTKESDLDTTKPVFFAEFEDMTNLTLRGMSIIPIGQDTHVVANETNTASLNVTDEHYYDVTLPYNSTADMYSITPVSGVEHGYHIKSFVSGKYLAFNGTPDLVDSDEPYTIYFYGNPNGFYEYGFSDFMAETDQEMNVMRAFYYDVDLGKFMAYTELEALARAQDGHPFRQVYLFNQTDTKPDAPIFSKAEGSVLRYGTKVEFTNNPNNEINGHLTGDGSDPRVVGSNNRMHYKDFFEIAVREQRPKGDEGWYWAGTFLTLEGTLTVNAVHSVGYLYSDVSTVHYTCPPQAPYTFVQVTNEDQLVAGKRYLVVAATHDKEGYWNHAMGAVDDYEADASFDAEYIDITNGFINLVPWYYSEPYILGGSTGAWTFTDNTFSKYVGTTTYTPSGGSTHYVPALYENAADATTFTITFDNNNYVEVNAGNVGKICFYEKGHFSFGDESDCAPLPGMMLFVEYEPEPEIAELDAVGGEFSVSVDKKIEFSRGNIQYHTGTHQWRAAEHQYDVIGKADNIRLGDPTLSAWVDLFAWSCESAPYGVSPSNKDADYTGDFMDWGANFYGDWYTPTKDEWQFLLTGRPNAADLRGEGNVAGMNGLILLPDSWVLPDGMSFLPGYIGWEDENVEDDYLENVYTADEWEVMEAAGAVFLPNGGSRTGGYGNMWNGAAEATFTNPETGFYSWVDNVDEMGYYWSSTLSPSNSNLAYYLITPGMTGDLEHYTAPVIWSRERRRGNSVRLVREYVAPPVITPDAGRYVAEKLVVTVTPADPSHSVYVNAAAGTDISQITGDYILYTAPMVLNDGHRIVAAYSVDSEGRRSRTVTAAYNIYQNQEYQFIRVDTQDDIQPGREYIVVRDRDEVTNPNGTLSCALGIEQTANNQRDAVEQCVSNNILESIFDGTILWINPIYYDGGAYTYLMRKDVSIFTLGEKDSNNRYTLFDNWTDKYLDAPAAGQATATAEAATTGHFSIAIDGNTHLATVTNPDGLVLNYDETADAFAFVGSEDVEIPVTLYWRPKTFMTLEEFTTLTAEDDPAPDLNGTVTRQVIITEPLTVAYALNAGNAAYLVLKDNDQAVERYSTKQANQKDLLIKGYGEFENKVQQKDYTQNNWMFLIVAPQQGQFTLPNYEVGQTVKAKTIRGGGNRNTLTVMTFTAVDLPEIDTNEPLVDVKYNLYTPLHFNDENIGVTKEYFMVQPKRMEVANVTYAVYNGNYAMCSDAGNPFNKGMEGSVMAVVMPGITQGKYGAGSGQAITSETTQEQVFDGMTNKAFQFQTLCAPMALFEDDWDEGQPPFEVVLFNWDRENGTYGPYHSPRRVKRAPTASDVTPSSDMGLIILNIDATQDNVFTSIEDIVNTDASAIKAVRYYNAAGLESDKPWDGVNIIVTEMTDGTRTVNKVLK